VNGAPLINRVPHPSVPRQLADKTQTVDQRRCWWLVRNRDPPFGNGTLLANGKIGERRGTERTDNIATGMMISIGFFIANWIGYGGDFATGDAQWRIPLAMQIPGAVALALGCFFIPYSLRWCK
jgi:Sugar (and other) transporter